MRRRATHLAAPPVARLDDDDIAGDAHRAFRAHVAHGLASDVRRVGEALPRELPRRAHVAFVSASVLRVEASRALVAGGRAGRTGEHHLRAFEARIAATEVGEFARLTVQTGRLASDQTVSARVALLALPLAVARLELALVARIAANGGGVVLGLAHRAHQAL